MLDAEQELIVGLVGLFLHPFHAAVHKITDLLELVAKSVDEFFVLLLD